MQGKKQKHSNNYHLKYLAKAEGKTVGFIDKSIDRIYMRKRIPFIWKMKKKTQKKVKHISTNTNTLTHTIESGARTQT